jgi:hypothetical protein
MTSIEIIAIYRDPWLYWSRSPIGCLTIGLRWLVRLMVTYGAAG